MRWLILNETCINLINVNYIRFFKEEEAEKPFRIHVSFKGDPAQNICQYEMGAEEEWKGARAAFIDYLNGRSSDENPPPKVEK